HSRRVLLDGLNVLGNFGAIEPVAEDAGVDRLAVLLDAGPEDTVVERALLHKLVGLILVPPGLEDVAVVLRRLGDNEALEIFLPRLGEGRCADKCDQQYEDDCAFHGVHDSTRRWWRRRE